MPRISEFFGIIVTMYFNDYAPPHFHARYNEHEAQLVIDSLDLLSGSFLHANWNAARRGESLVQIPGLE